MKRQTDPSLRQGDGEVNKRIKKKHFKQIAQHFGFKTNFQELKEKRK